MIHGDMSRSTVPRCRRPFRPRRRRGAATARTGSRAPATVAMRGSCRPSPSSELGLLVDLGRAVLETSLKVGVPRDVFVLERGEEIDVGRTERRDLLVARIRVPEDVEERLEVRVPSELRILQRVV